MLNLRRALALIHPPEAKDLPRRQSTSDTGLLEILHRYYQRNKGISFGLLGMDAEKRKKWNETSRKSFEDTYTSGKL